MPKEPAPSIMLHKTADGTALAILYNVPIQVANWFNAVSTSPHKPSYICHYSVPIDLYPIIPRLPIMAKYNINVITI